MRIDAHVAPYLEALPPAPHNSVVLLTTVSASTLRQLFDTASPPPSSPNPTPPSSPNPDLPPGYPGKRRDHGRIYAIVHGMVSLAVWGAFLVGLAGSVSARKFSKTAADQFGGHGVSGGKVSPIASREKAGWEKGEDEDERIEQVEV
ncbi:hypothetical protein JCM1840_004119 [Sporobolomyces johnsonii]